MGTKRKPNGYWDEFNNVKSELLEFIQAYGTAGMMPTNDKLRTSRRNDIASAIQKHGGYSKVARQLRLKSTNTAKPYGYWDDFATLEGELLIFIKEHGTPGEMPTARHLEISKRSDIRKGIDKHGGFLVVAEQLRLSSIRTAKPSCYWNDFANVKHELIDLIEKRGTPGVMPTREELDKAGRCDLENAIRKHGGVQVVAEQLRLTYAKKRNGYWDEFNNVKSELLEFIQAYGTAGMMPTNDKLRTSGRNDIASAIQKHGGYSEVARQLRLKSTNTAKPYGYWDDFATLERELLIFIKEHGTPGEMPTARHLEIGKRSDLRKGIDKHGGFLVVAERLGLASYTVWTVEAIRKFVSSLINHLGTFTPAELYLLFQQNGLLQMQGKGKGFVKALATGRFPQEEIEKFVNGEPSIVDKFLQDQQLTLESLETKGDKAGQKGKFCGDNDNISAQKDATENLDDQVDRSVASIEEDDLPVVQTQEVLASLDCSVVSSADEEAAEFLIASAKAKIWKDVFRNETAAVAQAEAYSGDNYAERVKAEFLDEYHQAKNLNIPTGYAFRIKGELTPPNLMQRLVAVRVRNKKRVGNWSGTGAGKTLSAVLASRVINAHLTVICCPNSVVAGWEKAIRNIFPESAIATKTFTPNWAKAIGDETGLGAALNPDAHHYLILNYERFQQPNSAALVRTLSDREKIDFVVIDEIHYTKQRQVENMSQRKQLVSALITVTAERNPDLHVIGMSATPVINNLQEGKSLVELVTGVTHNELDIKPTIPNCMRLHQRLVALGIRWMPDYKQQLGDPKDLQIKVDCEEFIDEIRALGRNGTPLALEQILTRARLPIIRSHIQPKTLIYTHYIQGIDKLLRDALEEDGWKVGFYTGEDKSGLDGFLNGKVDVLIGSSAIGTGVDGLQQVCNRLIINVLPWTHAEFEQLIGRIYRQGQQNPVTLVMPLTYAVVNGDRWSWCDSKMQRLRFKKSIADAAVDGLVPEGHLRSSAQAYQDAIAWLERLELGKVEVITRPKIVMPLPDDDPADVQRRLGRYGDFSNMNRHWNQSRSEITHHRLQANPEEWAQYHTLYRESRKDWAIVPYEEIICWCQQRSGYSIGDFGCGEAKLAEAVSDRHTVYSFDHIAVNNNVVACDMAHLPLDDETLDVAVFSLSLMGSNFTDYLREAHRTLKLDGQLHIIEATSRFSDIAQFQTDLEAIGFTVIRSEHMWKFTHIRAMKSERTPQGGIEIRL